VDGRWSAAYPSQRNATAPPDLVVALEWHPGPEPPTTTWAGRPRTP
jgi:hypothetical protein